jgi:hypothetical protein
MMPNSNTRMTSTDCPVCGALIGECDGFCTALPNELDDAPEYKDWLKETTMTKPKVDLLGANGNIFNIAAMVFHALRRTGQKELAATVFDTINTCTNYDYALAKLGEMVEFTWGDPAAATVKDEDFYTVFEEGQAFGDYEPDPQTDPLDDFNYVGGRAHY